MRSDELNCYTEFAEILRAVRSVRSLGDGVNSRLRNDCTAIRKEAYLCDAMLLFPAGSWALAAAIENDSVPSVNAPVTEIS